MRHIFILLVLFTLALPTKAQIATSALIELAATCAAGDWIIITDRSDTAQSANGSTRKIRCDNVSAFDNLVDPIVQHDTGSDVHFGDGAGTLTGKVEIGGDADQPQLVIECFSTQTDDCFIIQQDDDTEIFSVSEAGDVVVAGVVFLPDGLVGAPSIAFDPDTGIYSAVDNRMNFTAGGATIIDIQADGLHLNLSSQISASADGVGAPSYTWAGDLNTGPYHISADAMGIAANGVRQATFNTAGLLPRALLMQDDLDLTFGSTLDWDIQYDEAVDNQLLFVTTNTSAVTTTDPMFEILVGTTPTANQQLFGIAKGSQSSNTPVFTIDEDGDVTLLGTLDGVDIAARDHAATTDTGPSPDCSGTTTYQDGEGGCDDIAGVYENELDNSAGLRAALTDGVGTGNAVFESGAPILTGTNFSGIPSGAILTEVRDIPIAIAAWNEDGTQCAEPAQVTIGSWGKQWSVICTDNDASTLTFTMKMPGGWDAGTVTLELTVIQDAADTGNLQADVSGRCTSDGETPAAYGTEVSLDDVMTGTDAQNTVESAAITLAGTCAAGDLIQIQWQLDATGTTTAMATLNIVQAAFEFTSTIGD